MLNFPGMFVKFPTRKVKFPTIYVFLYSVKQNFPPNDKISQEWSSRIPHLFQAYAVINLIIQIIDSLSTVYYMHYEALIPDGSVFKCARMNTILDLKKALWLWQPFSINKIKSKHYFNT